jgi:hypothetical protein
MLRSPDLLQQSPVAFASDKDKELKYTSTKATMEPVLATAQRV